MNLRKLLNLLTFREIETTDLIDDQMRQAKLALVKYTLESEYAKSLQEFQRVRIQKLQELKNEINYIPDTVNVQRFDSAAVKHKPSDNMFG